MMKKLLLSITLCLVFIGAQGQKDSVISIQNVETNVKIYETNNVYAMSGKQLIYLGILTKYTYGGEHVFTDEKKSGLWMIGIKDEKYYKIKIRTK